MNPVNDGLQDILLTEAQIHARLDALAAELVRDYADSDLTVVAVLTGSVMFVADLLKRMPIQLRLDYIGVSSYHGGTRPVGELAITKALQLDVRNRDVLVVDDILDTGQTMARVRDILGRLEPRRLRFCVFLEKTIPHVPGATADYVGFTIPDKFVVGYGLDYRERYRNLPFVATLKPEVIARQS